MWSWYYLEKIHTAITSFARTFSKSHHFGGPQFLIKADLNQHTRVMTKILCNVQKTVDVVSLAHRKPQWMLLYLFLFNGICKHSVKCVKSVMSIPEYTKIITWTGEKPSQAFICQILPFSGDKSLPIFHQKRFCWSTYLKNITSLEPFWMRKIWSYETFSAFLSNLKFCCDPMFKCF